MPPSLLHPLPGFDVAVIGDVDNIAKVSKKIGRVTHGYLESIGCPKTPAGKRQGTTVFTAESGQTVRSTNTHPCT